MNTQKPVALAFAISLLSGIITLAVSPKDLPDGFTTLEIGDSAPDFSLPGTDGKQYSLKDFSGPDILVVYFTGTHCPTSHGAMGRVKQFVKDFEKESFTFIAINPNHSSGLRPDEFGHTDYDETFADSKRYAEDYEWTFPFLYDGEKQLTARSYGCLATPHVFIFDKERKLRYNGRFDDSRFPDPATVKHPDARNAMDALLAGNPVPVETTRPHGCSTKWKERSQHVVEEETQWQSIEATIEEIDAAGVAALAKNGTEKVRLINVWATWCVPCVEEFPDLTAIARKFSRREFELITISLDQPTQIGKAKAFLGKHRAIMSDKLRKSVQAEGRTSNNYLYTGSNIDELADALDPEWPGPVPYSVLINQSGKILYRKLGKIDPEVVRNEILDTLTRHYMNPVE
ncbi:MAG: redoxin domain-containing protein [Opitutales bacterium]|jgi:peroxiredoxin|nr:redoxin domain-containing protein [Opitutales bacterium]MBT5816113.1 redoxin domain-containing protein [Opitutales bacterium]MBT6378909.1 redoxin domain-containing protein [Opitutales bacterium]MBT6769897.1 redoxin domain-containing protein [Opitutales bacterium]